MTVTHDYAALCAAIDDGDDIALLALADLLEESDNPLAAAVRLIAERAITDPVHCTPDRIGRAGWCRWWNANLFGVGGPRHALASVVFDRVAVAAGWNPASGQAVFETRSAAYLAVAKILTEPSHV